MKHRPGRIGAILLLWLALAPVAADTAYGQVTALRAASAPISPRPWFYANSDVPIDPAWRFGTLPNGLRYAVRRNIVLPGQVSVRMRVDVGSLMERDDERGYAHFLEHLTFRGSRFVPDGESKRIWQRLGVTFGSDSNAQTSATSTTYALDLPDANNGALDASVRILAGMLSAPNIIPQAVEAERAVVLAEMREGKSADTKASEAGRAFFFAGQPLGARTPIGTPESLNAATATRLQAFHDRWYRPEHVVVVIAGDADPATLEALVRRNFAQWKGTGPAAPMADFGTPDPNIPATAVIVQPGVAPAITAAWLRPWRERADTIVYNQAKMTDVIALQIINRRLEAYSRSGKASFLVANVRQEDSSRSVDATYLALSPNGADWEKALADARAIIEDAKARAPAEREIEREYAEFQAAQAMAAENDAGKSGGRFADDIVQALDIHETTVSSQAALDILRGAREGMTPDAALAATRRLFAGDAARALLLLPSPEKGAAARLASAFSRPVAPASGVRPSASQATIDSLPPLGPAGKPVSRSKIEGTTTEMVTFANGVRLILLADSGEPGQVRINVRFGRGRLALTPRQSGPFWAGGVILPDNGIGALTQNELDQITTGRRLGMDFAIDDDAFELAAVTGPADFADELRLLAAKLAFPGWDPAPVERIRAALLAADQGRRNSPNDVIARELVWRLRDGDARYAPPDLARIQALDPKSFRAFWEPVLASGPIEVELFGDVHADEAIAAVGRTLGALPPRTPAAIAQGGGTISFPAHNQRPLILRHGGDNDQAAASIAWPTGVGIPHVRDARRLELLARIIGDRLFEKMRAVDGAAYSPSAFSDSPLAFDRGEGYLAVVAQLRPDRLDYFYRLVDGIAADLAARPIGEDELRRTLAPMREQLLRAIANPVYQMALLEGASRDPRYLAILKTLGDDLLDVSAEDLRALAARYLRPDRSFSLAILPDKAPIPKWSPRER